MASYFSFGDDQQDSFCPQLAFRERVIGFAICTVLGYFLQMMSFGSFIGMITGSPYKFAISYSLGNIITIMGTSFLVGFKKQLQNMVDEDRRIATIVFGGSLIMTLFCSIVLNSAFLVTIFVIVQICAYVWYLASYIPYARECIKNCLAGVIRK